MSGIFQVLYDIMYYFVNGTLSIIRDLYENFSSGGNLLSEEYFNIYLFSDVGWFSSPINYNDVFLLILTILYLVFFIKLLYAGTKKFINMVFGVFKL